ncbi:hypothetical protein [Paraburkholderia strydomiana]|uniref:hypothetical protein n=1 Tax=Paraburkholderia strydomiana TaxID=1245417 RepID=UPI001BE4FE46|nr:hypothetical protein [Paraburkholderia strydomiana]MBT2795274.1 hypothetical protein [Paraburkholderia strydomiana]
MAETVKVELERSQATYHHLLIVVDTCNQADPNNTSHGRLTVPQLLAMLAEGAAMINSRPGSWEGSNMQQVLDSHGYQNN